VLQTKTEQKTWQGRRVRVWLDLGKKSDNTNIEKRKTWQARNNASPIVPRKLDWVRRFICLGFFVYPSSFLTCSVMMIIDVQHSAVDN